MALTNKDIRKLSVISLILFLLVLAFFVLKPIILSIITGLILAYALIPVYRRVFKIFKEGNTSALAICVLIVIVLFIPLWFLIPLIVQQAFNVFAFTQTLDVSGFISTLFPGASEQFRIEVVSIVYSFIGKITTSSLSALTSFLVNLPNALLHFAVILFVFFFTLRDHKKLGEFVSGLSPMKKEKEKVLVEQFKGITSSIVFGYIIVGLIQGIATGIGLLVFGVPQALLLTIFAMFFSILPMVGPWIIWIPATIYLFASGHPGLGIGFALYSVLFVSTIDNILRPYIVARKTGSSPVVVLVGMIGGLLFIGILGILLGPLILSYLVLFLRAYKERTLSDMFDSE